MTLRMRSQRQAPVECPDTVRIANRKDASALYDLVFNGVVKDIAYAPPNEEKVRALVTEVTNPVAKMLRPVVAVIDGPDGIPVAAAPLLPKQWWYSDETHYVQPWIFVKEEYRRTPFAKTLLGTMIWWAERAAIPVVMTVPAGAEHATRREIYGRYATPFGGSFIHVGGMSKPTPKPDGTRVADLRDYQAIRELCLMLNKENASAPLRHDRLDALLGSVLRHNGGIIVVSEEGGKIVGCACLMLDQWDYSLSWHYTEIWVFVHPEHRTSGHAEKLLHFCKWWAEQTGIPVTVGITSRVRTKAKMRLYSRYMRPLETFFIHDPRGGAGGQENTESTEH